METLHLQDYSEYDEGDFHFFELLNGSLAEVRIDGEDLILEGLTVSPELRGKGYGSWLIKLVEQYAISHRCKRIIGEILYNNFDDDPTGFYIRNSYQVSEGRFCKELTN